MQYEELRATLQKTEAELQQLKNGKPNCVCLSQTLITLLDEQGYSCVRECYITVD